MSSGSILASLDDIVREVVANARAREELYLPRAVPLTASQVKIVKPFFPAGLLDGVRALELGKDERVPNPSYYRRARERGHKLMLDFTHMAEITHPRLIIFQEEPLPRLLFHALVHVVQYRLLGLEPYLERYVRAFVKTGIYVNVPLEVHAFQLDQRFTRDPATPFSVEQEVADWVQTGRY